MANSRKESEAIDRHNAAVMGLRLQNQCLAAEVRGLNATVAELRAALGTISASEYATGWIREVAQDALSNTKG